MKISAGYRVFTVFNTLFMLFLLVITLYPMYYCVVASFSDPDALARAAGKVLLWRTKKCCRTRSFCPDAPTRCSC